MSQETSVPLVALGGAAASIIIYLASPLLETLIGERPPAGVESAIGTLLTAALTYWWPARIGR